MEKQAKVVPLKTQLVKEGHTRTLLAETDLMTLRIHCYAPGIGENTLHAHTKEDHIFLVLQGTAQFNTGLDGQTVLNAGQKQRGCSAGRLLLSIPQLGYRWLWRGLALARTKRISGLTLTARQFREEVMNRVQPSQC